MPFFFYFFLFFILFSSFSSLPFVLDFLSFQVFPPLLPESGGGDLGVIGWNWVFLCLFFFPLRFKQIACMHKGSRWFFSIVVFFLSTVPSYPRVFLGYDSYLSSVYVIYPYLLPFYILGGCKAFFLFFSYLFDG